MSIVDRDFLLRRRFERRLMTAFLLLLGLIWSIPLVAAVASGFEHNGIQNFIDVIFNNVANVPLWKTYVNSAIIALIHASFVVVVASLAGYGFTYLEFPGKEAWYFAVIVFLAVPATSILVPLFYITRELGLRDSYFGVGLPEAALTMPFAVMLVRNFAENVPRTLIEAAAIDRADHLRIFWEIFVPICRPALLNIFTLSMMWSVQDFLFPSLFFSDPDKTTAAQAILKFKEYLGATPDNVGRYNASLVLLGIPALVVVIFGLRFITSGLTEGGVKE